MHSPLKKLRQRIISKIWQTHLQQSQQMRALTQAFALKEIALPPLDHFAVIDLPGQHSGIPVLKKIFSLLGFVTRGSDYLQEKQNDFIWMTEEDHASLLATEILPQIVAADFRLHEMPQDIRCIIEKYSAHIAAFNFETLQQLLLNIENETATEQITELVCHYFTGRDWPLPSIQEFKQVQQFNELLAWVLVFGRQPNHFTLALHLSKSFSTLEDFLTFAQTEAHLGFNQESGLIKGGAHVGIAQAATYGDTTTVQLSDGSIQLPNSFVEFVWRFPAQKNNHAIFWKDFYPDFIAQHANKIIESLYE